MPFMVSRSESASPIGPGLDSLLIQDGKIITFADGVNYGQDKEFEEFVCLVLIPLYLLGKNDTKCINKGVCCNVDL